MINTKRVSLPWLVWMLSDTTWCTGKSFTGINIHNNNTTILRLWQAVRRQRDLREGAELLLALFHIPPQPSADVVPWGQACAPARGWGGVRVGQWAASAAIPPIPLAGTPAGKRKLARHSAARNGAGKRGEVSEARPRPMTAGHEWCKSGGDGGVLSCSHKFTINIKPIPRSTPAGRDSEEAEGEEGRKKNAKTNVWVWKEMRLENCHRKLW